MQLFLLNHKDIIWRYKCKNLYMIHGVLLVRYIIHAILQIKSDIVVHPESFKQQKMYLIHTFREKV